MSILIGKEYCKLDPAGRFKFPASLKKMLSAVIDEGFVIRESIFDNCLELYPKAVFETEIEEKISKLNPYNSTDRLLIRKLSEGNFVELDASDRLLIPQDQKKSKNLAKEVVLISKINMIEIWDLDAYEKLNQENIDFALLAAKRLGKIEEEEN